MSNEIGNAKVGELTRVRVVHHSCGRGRALGAWAPIKPESEGDGGVSILDSSVKGNPVGGGNVVIGRNPQTVA